MNCSRFSQQKTPGTKPGVSIHKFEMYPVIKCSSCLPNHGTAVQMHELLSWFCLTTGWYKRTVEYSLFDLNIVDCDIAPVNAIWHVLVLNSLES